LRSDERYSNADTCARGRHRHSVAWVTRRCGCIWSTQPVRPITSGSTPSWP
jgi:hypothetical protein